MSAKTTTPLSIPRRDGAGDRLRRRSVGFYPVTYRSRYLHDGETYFVAKLDLAERVAYVHRTEVDYYTQTVTDRRVRIQAEQTAGWQKSAPSATWSYLHHLYVQEGEIRRCDPVADSARSMYRRYHWALALCGVSRLDAFQAVRSGRSAMEGLVVANVRGAAFAMCVHRTGALVDSTNSGVPTLLS